MKITHFLGLGVLALANADLAPARDHPTARQRSQAKYDKGFSREDAEVKDALRPVLAGPARSVVKVIVGSRSVAYGTVVHRDGYFVTKASELDASKPLSIELSSGVRMPATISDRLGAYDLALVKVDATGFTPVVWSEAPAPAPGSFLAAPSPAGEAVAVGVASVAPRSLYEVPRGFLGVKLRDAQPGEADAAIIEKVYAGGAAESAGLQPRDTVLVVDGTPVKDSDELRGLVSRRRPGDEVAIKVRRGDVEQDVKITLMDRSEFTSRLVSADDPAILMSGRLSTHRQGFFNVFQHDLILQPEECGGPLVDLEGAVVGLDIARSGRVETLAIPAEDMRALLVDVGSGKFALPNVEVLRDQLKKADLAILRAQEARELAEHALERAKALVDSQPTISPTTVKAVPSQDSTPQPAVLPMP